MAHTLVVPWDFLLTSLRWASGLSLGAAAGAAIALFEHRLGRFHLILLSGADFLRALPVIALVPIVQALSGPAEKGKIALIAWGAAFPVWMSVRHALREEMQDLELMMQVALLPPRRTWIAYDLLKACRGLIRGTEISIGIAWIASVAAEWVGTYTAGFWSGGIGYRLWVAYTSVDWRGMALALGSFGALGFLTSRLWRSAVRAIPSAVPGIDLGRLRGM